MVDGFETLYSRNPSLRTVRLQRGSPDDQPVSNPQVGDPISHHQIVQLWQRLFRLHRTWDVALEKFMKGSEQVFVKPDPLPEPTLEYKAFMKRLRDEADQREYERMVRYRNAPGGKARPFAGSSNLLKSPSPWGGRKGDNDDPAANYQKSLQVGGSFLLSFVGVPFAIWAICHWFMRASLETSLIWTAISVPLTICLELYLYIRFEEGKEVTEDEAKSYATVGPSFDAASAKAGGAEAEKRGVLGDATKLTPIPRANSKVDDNVRRRRIPTAVNSQK
ncbi:hypothetical protein MKZ38_002887 [Zalerion maritima]|uniref:Uncharacterized protein n=1 Tax=Zalerion maritima TaxID=339359 RepID=A0AAD5RY53_9PEZI|nr:hypothetical protein MKZ38_002887 [Zalerion maritima]